MTEALATLQSGQGIASLDAALSAAIADVYLALGDTSAAVEAANLAVSEDQASPEMKYVAARMEWHDDRLVEALEHIVEYRAARQDVDGALLHCAILGYLGDQLGDERCYEQVLKILDQVHDQGLDALRTRIVTLARLNQVQAAVDLLPALVQASSDEDIGHSLEHAVAAIVRTLPLEDLVERENLLKRIERIAGVSTFNSPRNRIYPRSPRRNSRDPLCPGR